MLSHLRRSPLASADGPGLNDDSAFRREADAALAGFRNVRDDLERQVRRGDLTPKVARERAVAAAGSLAGSLRSRAEGFSPVPRAFLNRLVEAAGARTRARESATLDGQQRETNRLLRQVLIEQQLASRTAEFEGRAFVRPMTGGIPAPTLESLLAFHESATQSGDEAAREWVRRQLESLRPRILDEADVRCLDRACERPDQVNPRIVGTYAEALRGRPAEELETFVDQAIDARDANACTAAFVLAREAPEGAALRWVRAVLDGLNAFPDAALATLRTWEAEARRADAESARSRAEFVIALAEAEARLAGVEAPSDAELHRRARFQARPVATPEEPIGLALDRRGLSPEEFEATFADAD